MPELLFQPTPHKEAVDFIAGKSVVSREVFNELLPELKGRAFVVAGIEDANTVQQIRDLVAALPAGANWADQKKQIAALASPFFVDPDADEETRAKQQAAAERKAELLLRTHGGQAYAAAAYRAQDRQRKVFPFWKYQSMGDGQVRESHAALDGIVLPADHEFWTEHYPPWQWGCRCLVVPLSEDDYQDELRADAAKPEMQRSVLEGTRLRRLEQERKLNLGPTADIDVRSDREKGKADGFAWHPGDVTLTVDQLQPRYDAATWANFEQWARTTGLDAKRTVWEWMGGQLATMPSAPPVVLVPPVVVVTRKAPVSAGLEVKPKGAHGKALRRTVALIDGVHDDGVLPRIPVKGSVTGKSLGQYVCYKSGKADAIGVSARGPWPMVTMAHEVGHFLDHQALGAPGLFASEFDGQLADWRFAIDATDAIRTIQGLTIPNKRYFLSYREKWARAYAQFVAVKSGDAEMRKQMDTILTSLQPWRQWSETDFAPVSDAIEQLFQAKGWMP